jgi:MFS family permease
MVSAGCSLEARSTPRAYYGWWVVLVAAAAMVGTLPGRTQGLGLITEPLLRDLGLDRVTFAQLNLWGTLVGALFGIGIGRLMDRFGARSVLTAVAVVLGAIVCAMSQVHSIPALAVSIALTRGFGQSALSVISIATVGHWFVRRIDAAMAVYSIVLSIGFMATFPLVGWMVQTRGWRAAWLAIGLSLLVGLAPVCWLVVRRSPADLGLDPDGEKGVRPGSDPFFESRKTPENRARSQFLPPRKGVRPGSDPSVSWRAAIVTPAFWVFGLGTALYGLVASGIGLFNESILAERQFGPEIYYQTLAVTAMTGLAGNFLGGFLASRLPLGRLLAASLFILAGGLAVLPHVSTIAHVMSWAAAMGIGGGILMVLFFSVWPRLYGRRDLGRIQGAAQALTVVASAIGPLLLALCVTWTGSYAAMFRVLAATVAAIAVAALVVHAEPAEAA